MRISSRVSPALDPVEPLRFDDRLATVLGQPMINGHGRTVQWRQLVELVARARRDELSRWLRNDALNRIAELMNDVPDETVAATARAIAGPTVPAELVALFAARSAAAAAALLTAARLDPAGWSAVRAVAAPDASPIIAALDPFHRDIPLQPRPDPVPEQAAIDRPFEAPLAALISVAAPEVEAATLVGEGVFRWECGPDGAIDWVEGAPRAALIGRDLAQPFAPRFEQRLPFTDELLPLVEEGALAGEWRWSGSPAFLPESGRFAGYRGFARREGAAPPPPSTTPEGDDLRELMHELRTPLNAIIGFGEIIEGQYLGPAHRTYRDRAALIVTEARRLSDAVDAFDLSAKYRSGRLQGEQQTNATALEAALIGAAEEAVSRQITLSVYNRASAAVIDLPPALAERLVRQFASAMVADAEPGDELTAVIDTSAQHLLVGIRSPRTLTDEPERSGTAFALRLVNSLAASTGGRLNTIGKTSTLYLPMIG